MSDMLLGMIIAISVILLITIIIYLSDSDRRNEITQKLGIMSENYAVGNETLPVVSNPDCACDSCKGTPVNPFTDYDPAEEQPEDATMVISDNLPDKFIESITDRRPEITTLNARRGDREFIEQAHYPNYSTLRNLRTADHEIYTE